MNLAEPVGFACVPLHAAAEPALVPEHADKREGIDAVLVSGASDVLCVHPPKLLVQLRRDDPDGALCCTLRALVALGLGGAGPR